jgi:hypothetical protein
MTCLGLLYLMGGAAAEGVTLKDAYDAAEPGDGYDKLVLLDPAVLYTGGLFVEMGVRCCIHGEGAVIDLEGGNIWVERWDTSLDIDHCVLTNGSAAIYVTQDAEATIRNNTIVDNVYGVISWYASLFDVIIENNIIANNSMYGIFAIEYVEPFVQYNTVWGNLSGDYMKRCG